MLRKISLFMLILVIYFSSFLRPQQLMAWGGSAHEQGTLKAINLFTEIYSLYALMCLASVDSRTPYDRYGPVIYDSYAGTPPTDPVARLAWETKAVDHYKDLEFVNVEGVGEGRDDPHADNPTSPVPVNYDDLVGEYIAYPSIAGTGRKELRCRDGGADYILTFEVLSTSEPYKYILRLHTLKCIQEQRWTVEPGNSDEVYVRVNGRKVWRASDVDRGNTFNINRDIPFYYRAWIQVYEEDLGISPIAIDDVPHHLEENNDILSAAVAAWAGLGSSNFTAFSHFIDIKKGRGIFDDYDGYSYEKGSGKDAKDEKASISIFGLGPIDALVNWWYNDEYVHIPDYYSASYDPNTCSPAVMRYCRYGPGTLIQRFPLAESTGKSGKGIPYSVFPPVDNMARYWWDVFRNPPQGYKKNLPSLAPVLHAIQDASVPHHTCGFLGNYHQDYEDKLTPDLLRWINEPVFIDEVKALIREWDKQDSNPPTSSYYDRSFYLSRTPRNNWPIDQIVTWMAVQSYNAMPNGGRYNAVVARDLVKRAMALSVLVLKMAFY